MAELLKLTDETIDLLSERITEMYKSCGASKKDTYRARLLLEEALLKYKSKFGENIDIYFRKYSIFNQNRFLIRIKSPSFDPFTLEENPMAFMINSVMSNFENNLPTWKYHNLENEIVFTLKKKEKLSAVAKIGISVAASIAVSIPARLLIPGNTLGGFVNDYLEPLSNAYAGMFCIMAVLMTFFAIALSIVNIGDMNAAGVTGGRIIKRYFGMSLLLVVILTIPILPFYEFGTSSGLSTSAKSVYDVIIGFIPSNLVSPFLNFNTMHIIIVGAMFGFSLLAMGQKGETTVRLFDEVNIVSITTNSFLNKFIYYYVAFKVFALITTSDYSELKDAGRLVVMIVLAELALFVFYSFYVCFRTKKSIKEYYRKMLPHFIVCLSSANFGAAFSTIVDGLAGLDAFDESSSIAINLGSVVYRPAYTLVFIFSSLSMASFYGVEISVIWVIKTVILSLLLVAAVPNIPGVSVSIITLLFAQLGLPNEAVSMMIAINAPLQFLTVAVDTWCMSAECVFLNYKHNLKKAKSADA